MRNQSPYRIILYIGYFLIGLLGFFVAVGLLNFFLSSYR
jgi:hypothetical protein